MTAEIERKYYPTYVITSFIKFSYSCNVSQTIGSVPLLIAYISVKLVSDAFWTGRKEGSVLVIAAITLATYSVRNSLLLYLKL
jgi:hypothetical protein